MPTCPAELVGEQVPDIWLSMSTALHHAPVTDPKLAGWQASKACLLCWQPATHNAHSDQAAHDCEVGAPNCVKWRVQP